MLIIMVIWNEFYKNWSFVYGFLLVEKVVRGYKSVIIRIVFFLIFLNNVNVFCVDFIVLVIL